MSIFKKKKRNPEDASFSTRKPDYFTQAIEIRKIKLASWLNQKTGGWSAAKKKAALTVFCVLFGTMSFYILAGSVKGHGFGNIDLTITHLRSGVHSPPDKALLDSVYQRAENTRLWLDSLQKNDTARLHAILLSKPFLLNDLQLIESIYHAQYKLPWNKPLIHPGF